MRILLSKSSRKILFDFLIKENNCNSLKELAIKLEVPFRSIQNWRYSQDRYLSEKIIPEKIKKKLEILDKQEDNWGKIKGGKKTYQIIKKKYGEEEIKKRQSNGGKAALKNLNRIPEERDLNVNDPLFLEFYGVLLGDGWLSKLNYNRKIISLIGISGNAKKDREFFLYLKKNISVLFNRKAYLKERPKYNSIELNFSDKILLQRFNLELGFPIGKKLNLSINKKIYELGYESMKKVIRGIFDTDGGIYFDKTPSGNPYPCIDITMKAPILINQIYKMLIQEGFKLTLNDYRYPVLQIKLKGKKQLNKWMKEIGSSNPRNLNNYARVTQLGLECHPPKVDVVGSNPISGVFFL
jgi:hypothetical protein